MTLLNEASKIYVGGTAVSRIYAGSNLVWAGSAWTPASLGGLEVWLDASTLALADGATVSAWPNLGSGVAPVIESWLVPINYKTNQLNGKGVVRFNGGGTSSHLHGVTTATHDFTMLYVTRRWGPIMGRAFSTKYPPTNVLVGFHSTGQDVAYDGGNWMVGATAWGTPPEPWKLYGLDGASPSTMRFYINGALKGTSPSGQGLGGGYVLSSYRGDSQTDETMDCDIAEVLIYTRLLSDADRIQAENYLRTKWALPGPSLLIQQLPAPASLPPPLEMPDGL